MNNKKYQSINKKICNFTTGNFSNFSLGGGGRISLLMKALRTLFAFNRFSKGFF